MSDLRKSPGKESKDGEGDRVDQAILDEVVRRVVKVAEPDRIILFGSAARAYASAGVQALRRLGPDSDLDLLVVKSGVKNRLHLAQQIYHNFSVGVPVDIVIVTPEDIEKYRDKVGTIVQPALREGIEIYATPNRAGRGKAEGGRQKAQGRKQKRKSTPPERRDPSQPAEWLRRARGNLVRAKADRRLPGVFYEDLCFDAQQAAEKAIKALLVARNVPFPKTHSIRDLLTLVSQAGVKVPRKIFQADVLTPYAVITRYPGPAEVTEKDYHLAIELAERVLRWAESLVRRERAKNRL